MIAELIEHIRFPTTVCIAAGVVSLFYVQKLTFNERFITLVILLNIVADLLGMYLGIRGIYNGDVYNVICPVEKVIILAVYYRNLLKPKWNNLYIIGLVSVVALSIGGYVFSRGPGLIHTEVYIVSGFVVAVLSYLHLRQIVLEKASPSTPVFWFGMANLIYYTLMVASVSARPAALLVSDEFAAKMALGNDIAYVLWSVLTLFGIVWSRVKP